MRLRVFLVLLSIQSAAFAADMFQTGWGSAFNASQEGILFFNLMSLLGVYTSLKSLVLAANYARGIQNRYRYWSCLMIFFAGVMLFYLHHTFNLLYNTVHF